MSSISGLTSNMSGYLSRLYAQGAQEDSKVNSTDKQSNQSSQGIASLVACLQQNAANATQSVEESNSLCSLGSLDSSTMRGAMMGQETTATDLSDQIAAMDTDSDGTVTKEEFLAAKPDDVTDEMASNLWDSFDTESAGSLSIDELQTAMESGRMQGPPPPPPTDVASTEETDETSDTTDSFISAMDTDGDGIITQEEFLAAKPDEVSTDMATNLWNQLDSEGTGSLSTSDFQTAMAANAPSQNNAEQFAEAFSMSSMNGFDPQMMMEAIEAYDFSSGYESMGQNSRSSVYATM